MKKRRIERLARKEEKNLVKRIFFLSFLSVIIAIFIFTFGVPILSKFADLTGSIFTKNKENKPADVSVATPILDHLPEATNSGTISVGGFAPGAQSVKVYLDDSTVGNALLEAGKFHFTGLNLKNGENHISAKSFSSGRESGFSNSVVVVFDNTEPKLEIETPQNGQGISGNNRVAVSGKTDKEAQVYANGFLGTTDSDGKFEVFVPLIEGENSIEVKAIDAAGNTKVETRKVNFHKS